MTADLAAIVPTEHVDPCLDDLDDRGVYDSSRRLEAIDTDHVAIPITQPVDHPAVDRIERGVAQERRLRTLADHLRVRGWSDQELTAAPSSYARIGDLVVIDGWPDHRPNDVGAALLDLHGDTTTVLAQLDIEGARRHPKVAHVAGRARTRTVHREHGIAFGLDLTEVMFSPGNQHERRRMGRLVTPGERVVDLCAGIGYFTLPMAGAGAYVTAIERNPDAWRWLSSNLTRNRVDAQVVAINADCRECSPRGDRVVIGHLPVHDCRGEPSATGGGYLDVAIRALTEQGWLHVHGLAYHGSHDRAADALRRRLRHRDVNITDLSIRHVKTVAPRTDHLVFDVHVGSATA